MKTSHRFVFVFVLFCSSFSSFSVFADSPINAWTNPASGNWEDLKWSQGIRPAPGQTIMLTNQGWKAVAIGQNTVQNFSDTLDVSSVILGGYTDSFNLLLLNYAGFETPLLAGSINVGTNSGITALASVLTVSSNNSGPGDLSIFAAFNQGEQAGVNAHLINLGNITNAGAGFGTYNQTNGTVNADEISEAFGSTFNQFDGANAIGTLWMGAANSTSNYGEYNMVNGWLTAASIEIYRGDFNQTGGSVAASLGLGAATYTLSGGILNLPGITIPNVPYSQRNPSFNGMSGSPILLQTGGTNFCEGSIQVYDASRSLINVPLWGAGSYVLSNGVLCVTGTVRSWMSSFQQWGGWHTNAGTQVAGDTFPNWQIRTGSFTLGGGTLITPSISVNLGDFTQSGGTNRVSGEVDLGTDGSPATFTLSGGLLTDLTTFVDGSDSATPGGQPAVFTQSGGAHVVTNLLRLSGHPPVNQLPFSVTGYVLSNGVLSAANIQIDNGAFFNHNGGTLTTPGLLTLGFGAWNENTAGQQFGQLLLSAPAGSNATFSLPSGNSCVVRFANSSSVTWSNQAGLLIANWHGSLSGGGSTQVIFGNNTSGLSSSQISQIRFSNPQGLPTGVYQARILSSGEVVPSPAPSSLQVVTVSSNRIDLTWTDNSSTETGFKIERSLDGASFVQIATVGANVTSYSNTGLSPSTTYFYRVRASNSDGDSPYSNVASTTTFGISCSAGPGMITGWWKGENSTADALGVDNGAWAGYGSNNLYTSGLVGQAFLFDGIHRDRVDLGNPPNLRLQTFTIEAWVKRGNTNQVSFDDNNDDGATAGEGGLILSYGRFGYGLGLMNDGRVLLSKIDSDVVFSSGTITDTSWHHIAVTKSPSDAVFYIDGQPASSSIPYTTTFTFNTPISIGSRGDALGGTFFGSVDEPSIYSRVLAASEIAAIHNAGPSGKCPVSGLPPDWFHQDIGAVGIPGSASFSAGAFQLNGSGNDIWNSNDQFQFAYRIWNGDGEIVARITRLDNTDPWAKAGVMFRNSLADNSDNAFAMFTSQNGAGFQSRTNSGTTTNTPAAGSVPGWVKLIRSNNLFTAYVSGDGQSWTLMGTKTISMTNQALVGVAVTAHNNAVLAEGDFFVRVDVPGAPPAPPLMNAPARQPNGNVQLVLQGEVGRTYEVQASSNLLTWTSLGSQFSTNGTVTVLDTGAAALSHRFYRAHVIP